MCESDSRARGATEGLDHVQFLARLVEMEMIDRERRMVERRIKAAKFPATKSLDSFDFKAIPKLNKMQVRERDPAARPLPRHAALAVHRARAGRDRGGRLAAARRL